METLSPFKCKRLEINERKRKKKVNNNSIRKRINEQVNRYISGGGLASTLLNGIPFVTYTQLIDLHIN